MFNDDSGYHIDTNEYGKLVGYASDLEIGTVFTAFDPNADSEVIVARDHRTADWAVKDIKSRERGGVQEGRLSLGGCGIGAMVICVLSFLRRR